MGNEGSPPYGSTHTCLVLLIGAAQTNNPHKAVPPREDTGSEGRKTHLLR
jgi:hypothetical protein